MSGGAWGGVIAPPIPGRTVKPRREGWTMVIDKGLGLEEARDWIRVAGDYVDLVKLAFGTSALYRGEVLVGKIALLREAGIAVMPGGTLAEIALLQDRFADYLARAAELGFDAVEISDGTIPLGRKRRDEAIASARARGFRVIGEVGKKHPAERLPFEVQAEEALADLAAGAEMVVIEARESGRGIGIYGPEGEIIPEALSFLAEQLPPARTIWEAPQKSQQEELILRFGPNVNLGNIPPAEVLALEAMRLGLRGDTLRSILR
ncbi:MAG: phosphosulfolactate synthase [Firmicutes bacterium]|nr:phosphosulfolactate synthase [Bacillota bacterium]